MCLNKVCRCFFLLLILTSFVIAQKSKDENIIPCNMENALQLVENQVVEAKKNTESVKLIKILIRAGEFTWDLNEVTSRGYYQNAFNSAKKHFAEKGFERTNVVEKSIFIELPDYRMEVIRSIAKKDGKWARKLTEELLKDYEKDLEKRDENDKQKEIQAIVRIATENVENNLDLSKYLFQQVMKYPLDSHWIYALLSVSGINPAYADELYSQLLIKYRYETPRRLLFLSSYPFANERMMGVDKFQYGGSVPATLTPNIQLQIDFANVFFARINQLAANPNDPILLTPEKYRLTEAAYMVSGLNDLEPYVRENSPQLLQNFNLAKSKAEAMLNAEERKKMDERGSYYKKNVSTFEEKLQKLEDLDSEGKLTDQAIVDMVFWLAEEEHFTKLEKWLDKIVDKKVKEDTVNFFYHRWSTAALKNDNYDIAKKYADKVPELEFRAMLYFDIVRKQNKNYNESAAVRDNLNDVSKLARKTSNSVSKAQVLLGLVYMYEDIGLHYDALNELSEAVGVINKLENPDIFSSYIGRQIVGKGFAYYASYSTPGYNLETAFQTISKTDYDLTMAHAESLNDRYFETLAVLAIANNCIENSKKLKSEKVKN